MSEIQIWVAIYLSVGALATYDDSMDADRKAFGIVLWPLCILVSMVCFPEDKW